MSEIKISQISMVSESTSEEFIISFDDSYFKIQDQDAGSIVQLPNDLVKDLFKAIMILKSDIHDFVAIDSNDLEEINGQDKNSKKN